MTMARLALRLAAVESLLGTGSATAPTLAGPRVFDSRNDPIDDLADSDRVPVITIVSDEDTLDGDQLANGLPSGTRRIDLRIQFGFVQGFTDPESGAPFSAAPVTDAGMEALLDVMEAQIAAALNPNRSALMRAATTKILRAVSRPLSPDIDRTMRVAARELVLTCEAVDDWGCTHGGEISPASLPEPLAAVAALIPGGSYANDVISGILHALSNNNVAFPVTGIDISVRSGRHGGQILASAETC